MLYKHREFVTFLSYFLSDVSTSIKHHVVQLSVSNILLHQVINNFSSLVNIQVLYVFVKAAVHKQSAMP